MLKGVTFGAWPVGYCGAIVQRRRGRLVEFRARETAAPGRSDVKGRTWEGIWRLADSKITSTFVLLAVGAGVGLLLRRAGS